jgi:hypothetical protein
MIYSHVTLTYLRSFIQQVISSYKHRIEIRIKDKLLRSVTANKIKNQAI